MTRSRPRHPLHDSSVGTALASARSVATLASWTVALGSTVGWMLVIAAAPIALGCPAMSSWACSAGSAAAAGALLVAVIVLRACWLGLATARGVRALAPAPIPPSLAQAARRSSTTRVRCVNTYERMAFCADLLRPTIYVSRGLVADLADDELAAVLAHESAHARRRDPLRGLLARAGADVVFFAPLLRWWQHRRHVRAEVAADRAAIAHAGAPAVAGALLRLAGPAHTSEAAAAAFGATAAVLEARIAALTATPAPRQGLPTHAVGATAAGVLSAGVVVSCLPALVVMLG